MTRLAQDLGFAAAAGALVGAALLLSAAASPTVLLAQAGQPPTADEIAAVHSAGPTIAAAPPAVPSPDADPVALAREILAAMQTRNYRLLAALLLFGSVYALRRWGGAALGWIPRFGPWFARGVTTDRGGAALALGVGVLGGVATTMAAGAPLTASVLLDGAVLGATASGGYTLARRLIRPADAPPKALPGS